GLIINPARPKPARVAAVGPTVGAAHGRDGLPQRPGGRNDDQGLRAHNRPEVEASAGRGTAAR
ncbi:hypothetical protein, partial [uncultured Lamprocystis sp.]|uniref:hypothetical protein n=1 Tax=uncultured Lamprocystis sp. TaxID=543132 RepID=UPI0025ECFCB3